MALISKNVILMSGTQMRDTISARLSDDSNSGKLKLYLNLTKAQVSQYSIDANQYVSVKSHQGNKNKFIIRFHSAPIPMVTHKWKVTINKVKSEIKGATVSLDPTHFPITQNEKILGVTLGAANDIDGVVIEITNDSFVKTGPKEVAFLNAAEKKALGFDTPSSWGEPLETIIPDEISTRIENYLRKKYS